MANDAKLRTMQKVQNEMLVTLRDICDRHGLKYYLAQGTLIGAVRHKGFIPWDDDIDVIMPVSDILKLEKIFDGEAPKEYHLQSYRNELFCPTQWTKIRKDYTASMPEANKFLPIHWGICIDIFPMFNLSGNKLLAKLQWLGYKVNNKLLLHSMKVYTHEMFGLQKLAVNLSAHVRRFICDMITKTLILPFKPREKVFVMCKGGRAFDKRIFDDGRNAELEFEGSMYSVPDRYDEFLTEFFGDYMTLPPVEERVGHDGKMGRIIWSAEKDYREFL